MSSSPKRWHCSDTDADEIVVDGAKAFRDNAGPHEHALVEGFNHQAFALFGHL